MADKQLSIAVIGMGVMGRNHYRVLKFLDNARVSALCDVSPMECYEEPFFGTVDELLASQKPDAAVIAVPTPYHLEVALKCIDAGVHLLLEKPVAGSAEDGERIGEAAAANSIKVAIGHIERFNPVVGALKAELESKEVFSIAINRIGPLPPRIGDVGVLTDLAVHDIDLIQFITRKRFADTKVFKSQKIHNHHEDNAILSFRLENDILASITTNWLTPFKKRTIEVATRNGYYEADLMSQELTEYAAFIEDDEYVRKRSCHVTKGEPLQNEHRAFAELVLSGNRGDLATIEDGLLPLRIIENS